MCLKLPSTIGCLSHVLDASAWSSSQSQYILCGVHCISFRVEQSSSARMFASRIRCGLIGVCFGRASCVVVVCTIYGCLHAHSLQLQSWLPSAEEVEHVQPGVQTRSLTSLHAHHRPAAAGALYNPCTIHSVTKSRTGWRTVVPGVLFPYVWCCVQWSCSPLAALFLLYI